MFKAFTRKTSTAAISLALGAALVAVPVANAETPGQQPKEDATVSVQNNDGNISPTDSLDNKADEKGESFDMNLLMSKPEVWGSVLGVVIGLPILGLLFQAIIDFFGHTRF